MMLTDDGTDLERETRIDGFSAGDGNIANICVPDLDGASELRMVVYRSRGSWVMGHGEGLYETYTDWSCANAKLT